MKNCVSTGSCGKSQQKHRQNKEVRCVKELTSAGIGELTLRGKHWLPEREPEAVIVLAHGLAEHCAPLRHIGHGAGCARFCGVRSITGDMVAPAAVARTSTGSPTPCPISVRLPDAQPEAIPARPCTCLVIAWAVQSRFASALRLQDSLRGLVLSAPALAPGEQPPALRVAMARLLSAVAPNVGALKLDANAVSRDLVVREYTADPLVFHGSIPARTVVELLDAMASFAAQASRLRLPTLVLHGTADRLVPVAALRPLSGVRFERPHPAVLRRAVPRSLQRTRTGAGHRGPLVVAASLSASI